MTMSRKIIYKKMFLESKMSQKLFIATSIQIQTNEFLIYAEV